MVYKLRPPLWTIKEPGRCSWRGCWLHPLRHYNKGQTEANEELALDLCAKHARFLESLARKVRKIRGLEPRRL